MSYAFGAMADRGSHFAAVESETEFDEAIDLATRSGKQYVEITCKPASSNYCLNGFVSRCESSGGGPSTNPDGTTTCSWTEYSKTDRSLTLRKQENREKNEATIVHNRAEFDRAVESLSAGPGGGVEDTVLVCTPAGAAYCEGGFVAGCERGNGGLSTNPDGTVSCSFPHVD